MTASAGAERQRVDGFGRLDLGLREARDLEPRGSHLIERQWGTVREDYSPDGDAWNYLPHDHARSRAYRWGEDGLAGFCDIEQRLCVAGGLWNGRFRGTMRAWWRSHDGLLPDSAPRLCGSADIYDRPDEGADPV